MGTDATGTSAKLAGRLLTQATPAAIIAAVIGHDLAWAVATYLTTNIGCGLIRQAGNPELVPLARAFGYLVAGLLAVSGARALLTGGH
jgi:hypothetical protein